MRKLKTRRIVSATVRVIACVISLIFDETGCSVFGQQANANVTGSAVVSSSTSSPAITTNGNSINNGNNSNNNNNNNNNINNSHNSSNNSNNFIAINNGSAGNPSSTWVPFRYEAPSDCQWWLRDGSRPMMDQQQVALACELRTINSEFDTTNFSIIPAEHTTSLRINCNAEIGSRSSLTERSFAHLTRLRELVLDSCKLGKWPSGALIGLNDLRNLTVKTGNIETSVISLELSGDSFAPVKHLERLDLSTNNIWSLPENVFCPLQNLILLNVSENRLQNVDELGFREKTAAAAVATPSDDSCSSLNTRVLDVSYNHFVLLPSNGFSLLKGLTELRARNNEINMIAERALAGLKYLRVLDLSNNRLVSIPGDLFADCADFVSEIYLQNNSISILSPRLFVNLNQLLSLDLSSNQLTNAWMNNETFSGLIRLVLLNLSHNRISKLDRTLFHDLYTLQILNLESNYLESIPADTFSALNNLHTLILSYNRIVRLEQHSLNGLFALSLLSLDNNRLRSLHERSLLNCTVLQELNLNGNNFTAVPVATNDMHLLKMLDLGENSIVDLDGDFFRGMNNLHGLRLIANRIATLNRRSFGGLPALQILNLSQNRIVSIENGTFRANEKLEAIRLDNNLLTDMGGIFESAASLVWLNMSENRLIELDFSALPTGLQWLDVRGNYIRELKSSSTRPTPVGDGAARTDNASVSGLPSAPSLRTLDVSFNKLTKITRNSVPDTVQVLFANDNLIAYVEPHSFLNKSDLIRVDLYANQITGMDLAALQIAPRTADRSLPEFYIAGNPFQCDCTMEWLQRINKLQLKQHPVVMDIGQIYCKLMHSRQNDYVPLTELTAAEFLCPYQSHCYTLCQCCVFDACDCEMNCPVNCSCYHDQSWSANIVDCHSANYSEMPNTIPMDATEIYLDGNRFGELTSHSFIGRKNLRTLYANNSNIRAIYNYTFSGLQKLLRLHLDGNQLRFLYGSELTNLTSLKELYLQNNLLEFIHNRTFAQLKNLEIVRLDGNRLTTFEIWQFISNPYLVRVSLANNPWSCQCRFVSEFRMWINDNAAKIVDSRRIYCTRDNVSTYLISSSGANVSCISYFGSVASETQTFRRYLSVLLLTSCIFAIVLLPAILIFLYRRELLLCLYSNCGFGWWCYKRAAAANNGDRRSALNGDRDLDGDRLFDAYIAYCIKDEDFVTQILCSNLERNGNPYRLCLHYRDFNVNSYVADTIIEAAESSKRTIVVLSKNFLHTEWCRFEYKSALREVLRDRRNKTVFVLLGDVPQRELDPDLRLYLKLNVSLRWGDALFWQKFKCSMPNLAKGHHQHHPSNSFSISSIGCRTDRPLSACNVYATPTTTASSYYSQQQRQHQNSSATLDYHPNIRISPQPPPYTNKVYTHFDNGVAGTLANSRHVVSSLSRNDSHRSLPKNINIPSPWP